MVSTFDPYDQVIRDSEYGNGRRVVTFANVLQHKVFPYIGCRYVQLSTAKKCSMRKSCKHPTAS